MKHDKPKFAVIVTVREDTGEVLAAYFSVRDTKWSRTVNVGDCAALDYDARGRLIGVEVVAPCDIPAIVDRVKDDPHLDAIKLFVQSACPTAFFAHRQLSGNSE